MNNNYKNEKFSIKKTILVLSAVFIVIVSLCVLGACQSNNKAGSQLKVQDLTGKEFVFDQPIKKVVSTHNPILNHVIVLGNGTSKYLAGFGNKDKADGLYKRVLDDWDQLELIGGKGMPVNKETIVKLHPDLALVPEILSKMKDEDYGGTGVDPFVCMPAHETLDSIKDTLKQLSELFGEQDRANEVADEFDTIIKESTDKVKNISEDKKPKVLFMGGQKYKVATNDMIQTQLVELGGGVNAAKQEFDTGFWANADAETIVKLNPDVIYFVNYASYKAEDLLNDEKLQNVNAIKNKKVFEYPCKLEPWDYPTCSICLGLSWIVNNLYPTLVTKDELIKQCNDYYKLLYNKTFSPTELGL